MSFSNTHILKWDLKLKAREGLISSEFKFTLLYKKDWQSAKVKRDMLRNFLFYIHDTELHQVITCRLADQESGLFDNTEWNVPLPQNVTRTCLL